MAITLSKLFMRTISQNQHENQTGISLWTLRDIEAHQAKQKEKEIALAAEVQQRAAVTAGAAQEEDDDDDDYGDGGMDDSALAQIDLDV